ncbi:MFS transporter [Parabacteroides chinchillae]|uniref:Predicted arabinose efflux permease, MFS family n=1 Tax=Parabacteroides chinchillae TaxID=871327 RepID=A0A8G2BVH6_9BACT|nr:MFS transporter [Parabacteroides chinchillae]SEF72640.1 Predicted arabinose efflux permease, MFS family [Parabacteroides chinchillae]
MAKDKLVSPGFCYILTANFLLFFAFYLILPILPFYLKEQFMADKSMIGFILSCYTIACLCIRPFAGYLLDTFSRRPLYLLAYFIFTAIFSGYMLATTLTLFIALRIVHGFAFGMVTVSGNTIVIDILPSSRRGEGIGYYGLANNTAMSFGPMIGLFMHGTCSYEVIFTCSLLSGSLGLIMAYMVKTPYKQPVKREPISLDRFFLVKGAWAGISLLLLSIPYGMTTTYVAMYAEELGITVNAGLYFTFMAIGLAISRLFSGRQVDKGRITLVISLGMYLACISFFMLASLQTLMKWNPGFTSYLYVVIALLQGVAFGTMFPAFNTLFVNLAPNSQRGTATSTYLTSWDVGIGTGLMIGGSIAQRFGGFDYAYLFGACLTILSTLFFQIKASPHYNKNKLR